LIHTTKEGAGALDLPDLSLFERVERLGKAKKNNVEMTEFIAEVLDRDEFAFGMVNNKVEKLYDRMKTCASWLTFRHYVEHNQNRLTAANFCGKHLLCQACAIRRGAQKLQAYSQRVDFVLSAQANLSPWLITITVKNGERLHERFEHLQKSFQLLQSRRKKHLQNPSRQFTEFAHINGAVFSYEVPKSKDGEDWHPHIHMLALCTKKPEVGHVDPATGEGFGLAKEWFDITGDSFMIDVRRNENQDVIEMACEVMKYAVKFTDQEPADTWHAFQTLNGRRLFGSFGSLRGVKIPESLLDAPLDGPFVEYVYRYFGGGQYEQVSRIDFSDSYEAPMVRTLPEGSLSHIAPSL